MNETFVRIKRSILYSDLWSTKEQKTIREAFIDILLSVNFEPKTVFIYGKRFECGRFQSLKSINTWAGRWNCKKDRAYYYLRQLKKKGYIRIENMKYTTRITVLEVQRFFYLGSDGYKESVNGFTTAKSEKSQWTTGLKQESFSEVVNGKKNESSTKQVEDSMYKGKILKENSLNEIEEEKIRSEFFENEKKVFEKEKKQVIQGELFKGTGMSYAEYERQIESTKRNRF